MILRAGFDSTYYVSVQPYVMKPPSQAYPGQLSVGWLKNGIPLVKYELPPLRTVFISPGSYRKSVRERIKGDIPNPLSLPGQNSILKVTLASRQC